MRMRLVRNNKYHKRYSSQNFSNFNSHKFIKITPNKDVSRSEQLSYFSRFKKLKKVYQISKTNFNRWAKKLESHAFIKGDEK